MISYSSPSVLAAMATLKKKIYIFYTFHVQISTATPVNNIILIQLNKGTSDRQPLIERVLQECLTAQL